jgi:5'-3' exoribonuclease 1
MGIPSYFYQIVRQYGERFFGKGAPRVGRLFLDLNCCIHGCKNRVLSKWEGPVNEHFENQVIQEVIHTIERFCKETSPTELLWIAVDGVVPLAKMRQQRERRLRAIETKNRIVKLYEQYGRSQKPQWDSNAITPGTPFMLRLCDTVRTSLPKIQKGCGVKKVAMNGVRNPGEGEQKIFAYMRDHPGETAEYEDIVYGLDADLIILSILQSTNPSQKSPIGLLREQQAFGSLVKNEEGEDVLLRFKVGEFGSILPREWGGGHPGAYPGSLLRDYIILMSLMGNDFVPHTPSLTFRSEGVERLLDAYRAVGVAIVNEDLSICWEALASVLERLVDHEQPVLKNDEETHLKIRGRILRGQVPFRHAVVEDPLEQEILAMDWEHLRWNHTIRVHTKGWQQRYYDKMAGKKGVWTNTKIMVQCITKEYQKAVYWCWEYYRGNSVCGNWYYPYVSGPLLEDIVKELRVKKELVFPDSVPLDRIPVDAQLVNVLPPESHHCLSQEAIKFAKECMDLYPVGYDMWSYGKRHDWEREGFLPRIPIERMVSSN